MFNWSKRIIWAYSFTKKKKKESDRFFAIFKSIFLKNRSLSNAWWWFCGKTQNWEGNLYFTENRLSRNEMRRASDNHIMCHICAKELSDRTLIKQLFTKYNFFKEIAPNFTYSKNHNFLSITGTFSTNRLLKISWQRHVRNVLFHFCQPLTIIIKKKKRKERKKEKEKKKLRFLWTLCF